MTSEFEEVPKDLGVKFGTPELKFWTDLKKSTETAMTQCKHEIIINEALMTLCDLKIAEEKETFK